MAFYSFVLLRRVFFFSSGTHVLRPAELIVSVSNESVINLIMINLLYRMSRLFVNHDWNSSRDSFSKSRVTDIGMKDGQIGIHAQRRPPKTPPQQRVGIYWLIAFRVFPPWSTTGLWFDYDHCMAYRKRRRKSHLRFSFDYLTIPLKFSNTPNISLLVGKAELLGEFDICWS